MLAPKYKQDAITFQMRTLHINKENVFCDFEKLSKTWETSSNIAIRLDIEQVDVEPIVKELLGK